MSSARQLHLNVFLDGSGHHLGSWRHPDARIDTPPLARYARYAQIAEDARFDAVFFADSLAMEPGIVAGGRARGNELEPLTLLSALAATTRHIGLIGTATTSYNAPYHVARTFASLDQISGGRAGWNLVTSDNAAEAANFDRDAHFAHADRYARASEFHQVVTGLWDSWDEDALLLDKAGGRYFDPGKLHRLQHRGEHFSVAGPLNVSRSAQGRPVIVQAGSSEAGRALAARTADVVFTAQSSLEDARAFYADLKDRLPAYGRAADELKILPGLYALVGRSQAEAQRKHDELQALIDPQTGLALLGRMIGNFDLSAVDPEGPLPELPQTETGQRSRQQLLVELARREGLNVRQLYERVSNGRGHLVLIGTPEHIADGIQQWFEQGAADGFNLMPPLLPNSLQEFAELVVPELQRRGLFRREYGGSTLREHLGLAVPGRRRGHAAA